MRRTVLLLAFAAACGSAHNARPPLTKIPLPKGTALKPYDAANPGTPHPYNMVQLGDKLFVALGNLRSDYSVGGPGFLVGVVPSQGFTDVVDLGGADGHECQNSGAVRTDGTLLYVTCAGDFNGTGGRALVEVDPAAAKATRTRRLSDAQSPSGVAVTASKVWMGLSGSASLISVDRTSFALADGSDSQQAIELECPHKIYAYVPDLLAVGSDLYALCSSDQAGVLFRLDPASGALRGQANVGATPTALAATPDGRVAVVCSGDNTLWVATPAQSGTITAQLAHTYANGTSTLQGVRSSARYVFTTASGSNTVQKIDVSVSPAKVVAEATMDTGTAPWDVAPINDDEVVVSGSLSDDLIGLTAVDFKAAPQ